jgi:peptide/nickel transport system permease protein
MRITDKLFGFINRMYKISRLETFMFIAGLIIVVSTLFLALFAELIAPYDPIGIIASPLQPPSAKFIFGTDTIGRDVFSRVIYGARIIMQVILISTVISLSIGVVLGLLSGYVGGFVDRTISLVMDSIYAFPSLILAIAVAAMIGPGVYNTALTIAFVYIPTYFKMIRGQTLTVKEQLYVESAKSLGSKTRTIIFSYIFPNVLPIIPVIFSLNVADTILTEAGLSFFALGVPAPTPDWGFDIKNGQRVILSGYWWPLTFPGISVILLALGFSLLGEGLNELMNPRRGTRLE